MVILRTINVLEKTKTVKTYGMHILRFQNHQHGLITRLIQIHLTLMLSVNLLKKHIRNITMLLKSISEIQFLLFLPMSLSIQEKLHLILQKIKQVKLYHIQANFLKSTKKDTAKISLIHFLKFSGIYLSQKFHLQDTDSMTLFPNYLHLLLLIQSVIGVMHITCLLQVI